MSRCHRLAGKFSGDVLGSSIRSEQAAQGFARRGRECLRERIPTACLGSSWHCLTRPDGFPRPPLQGHLRSAGERDVALERVESSRDRAQPGAAGTRDRAGQGWAGPGLGWALPPPRRTQRLRAGAGAPCWPQLLPNGSSRPGARWGSQGKALGGRCPITAAQTSPRPALAAVSCRTQLSASAPAPRGFPLERCNKLLTHTAEWLA